MNIVSYTSHVMISAFLFPAFLAFLALVPGGIAYAEEEETTGTTIIGTKEAPNVLNVVPWQGKELNADPWEIRPSPAQSVLEDSLQPIDRDVLRREIEYFNLIQSTD